MSTGEPPGSPRTPPLSWPTSRPMRVLYFGTYERRYPRNAQVISCLRRAGVEVLERHEPVWEDEHKWQAGAATGARLMLAEARLLARPRAGGADAVLVGYPGHSDLPA